MRQFDAIDRITKVMKEDPTVRALFLKGSIAHSEMDHDGYYRETPRRFNRRRE